MLRQNDADAWVKRVEPLRRELVLADGGVYDNLGLETAWKKHRTILVSDAGGRIEPYDDPKGDWVLHGMRVTEVIDNQVRSVIWGDPRPRE